jgi:hypothetical protein
VFRDFISTLSTRHFWLSKWVVSAVVLLIVLALGIAALLASGIDFDTFLNYFALGLLIFVLITLFYGIIAIHDVPFTLHAIWPFLWIWAMLYRPDRGWGMHVPPKSEIKSGVRVDGIELLNERMARLERRMNERTH